MTYDDSNSDENINSATLVKSRCDLQQITIQENTQQVSDEIKVQVIHQNDGISEKDSKLEISDQQFPEEDTQAQILQSEQVLITNDASLNNTTDKIIINFENNKILSNF